MTVNTYKYDKINKSGSTNASTITYILVRNNISLPQKTCLANNLSINN